MSSVVVVTPIFQVQPLRNNRTEFSQQSQAAGFFFQDPGSGQNVPLTRRAVKINTCTAVGEVLGYINARRIRPRSIQSSIHEMDGVNACSVTWARGRGAIRHHRQLGEKLIEHHATFREPDQCDGQILRHAMCTFGLFQDGC
eukprot:scaffold287_cov337-Pavlova_lutheri.AAC.240